MENGYVGQFRGIPIVIKPDNEITEIVLPKSLATHILQLQNDKIEYTREKLKSIFTNINRVWSNHGI